MAIYHLEAKVISRSTGRSAVAASAYMSCSKILNDYDGVLHDFTRKRGLVWEHIFLPENAPQEWQDRSELWNAVERTEKTKDSRLARELVVALPVELGKEQWINLLTDYIQNNFVADGMCADVAIHDTDGHNPHAHIMLTVRPLDDKGKWQHKTEKEYLCKRNGEEKGFTAAEFLLAKSQGWEKQYQYYVGKKKVYMPPSEAERNGYERANKYPKSTKFGRQNPITARWNSDEQLVSWRENWAQITNKYLDEVNRSDAHIDHRSHAARGIDEQPTIHEGYVAQAMERRGLIADRCEINRQIKADNALLRELKSAFKKISQAVKNTVPTLAEAMETLREKVIVISYHILHAKIGKRNITDYVKELKANYESYKGIVKQIAAKKKEQKELQNQKKSTPVIKVITHRDLARRIAELTEEIEELKSEKARLLTAMERTDDKDVATVNDSLDRMKSALTELDKREEKYTAELNEALQQYAEYKEQAKEFNEGEFGKARLDIRPDKERNALNQISNSYGEHFSRSTFFSSVRDADMKLDDDIDMRAVREYAYQQRRQTQKLKSRKSHEQER
ncbi:MobQ family relaxase [Ruminococcus difficilis]|uniref:MobA/MobL family protein n=1 Tax=Ruminococcus difficilis TaxID=2763069 RepID=A0A934WS72_9FIRM|nr:MobQ family relaxase [Ruminococcus difficilis]MBK6088961.1 MobA/MobL family protein [Ruminococcus difficilis]MEE1017321.1 MobQ family relaxase [Ruminococcus sp.]